MIHTPNSVFAQYEVVLKKREIPPAQFDAGKLLVHGKGKKDRTVPIPEAIRQELKTQIAVVGRLHDQDLAAGYDGVFLEDDIEKKYPKAPKEFSHQWVFPQQSLTLVEETGERRRYHLHESQLQGALYHAVRKAKIPKKVTAHTFRTPSLLIFFRTDTYSRDSDFVGAFQPEDDNDLYPLRTGVDGEGAEEPPRFLIFRGVVRVGGSAILSPDKEVGQPPSEN